MLKILYFGEHLWSPVQWLGDTAFHVKGPLHGRQGMMQRTIGLLLSCDDSFHAWAVTASCHRTLQLSPNSVAARLMAALKSCKNHLLLDRHINFLQMFRCFFWSTFRRLLWGRNFKCSSKSKSKTALVVAFAGGGKLEMENYAMH